MVWVRERTIPTDTRLNNSSCLYIVQILPRVTDCSEGLEPESHSTLNYVSTGTEPVYSYNHNSTESKLILQFACFLKDMQLKKSCIR
jgi:hypothetical protein